MAKSYGFSKSERITSKKTIAHLFEKGEALTVYPLKLLFLESPGPNHSVLITVPKGRIKKAVSRNLIKRRLREAFRQNKHMVSGDKSYYIALIFLSNEELSFQLIEEKLKLLFTRFNEVTA